MKLWCRLQVWLRSGVAVVWAGSCSSNSTPNLGTSICWACSPKNTKVGGGGPGHSKSDSIEAKGNWLADAEAKQAALNRVPSQFWVCTLLKHNSDEAAKKFLLQAWENKKQACKKKGRFFWPPTHKYGLNQVRGLWYLEVLNYCYSNSGHSLIHWAPEPKKKKKDILWGKQPSLFSL